MYTHHPYANKLTDTLLTDIKTSMKAVDLDLDSCQSAIWMLHIEISTRDDVDQDTRTSMLHWCHIQQVIPPSDWCIDID